MSENQWLKIWLKDEGGESAVPRAIKAVVAPMFVVRFFMDGCGFMSGSGGCSAMYFTRRKHYQLTGKKIDGEPIYREKYEPMLTLREIPKVYIRTQRLAAMRASKR